MTTIPLQTALERATKGPVEYARDAYSFPHLHVNGVKIAKTDCSTSLGEWVSDAEETRANAILLAHCRNTLPVLCEAAEAMLCEHDDQCRAETEVVRNLVAALQAAQEVKMP